MKRLKKIDLSRDSLTFAGHSDKTAHILRTGSLYKYAFECHQSITYHRLSTWLRK